MGRTRFEKAFQALILSLLFHLAVTLGIYWAPAPQIVQAPIEVTLLDNNSLKTRQIVDETEQKPKDLLKDLQARNKLLSKYNKRVKKEQIARKKTGETQNRSGGGQNAPAPKDLNLQPQKKSKVVGIKRHKPKVNPLLNGPGPRGSLNNSLAMGESTSGFDVPGVQSGNFTALNTDQFTYYSFFERVNKSIRFRWVSGVRNFARQAPPKVINQLAKIPAPTVLRVLLDKEGMVVKVDVLSTSGSDELDQAAVQAFYQASPLNHPPDGMIREDRMVHLNYSFKVHFRPVYMAKGEDGE